MILSQLVTEAYLAYRGKTSSVPASGTEKYTRILTIANRKQREWAQDSNVDWLSRYEIRSAGTLSSGTQTYDIDSDVMRLSYFVILTNLSAVKSYVSILKPQQITRFTTGAYVAGFNPQQLTFITTITSAYTGFGLSYPCFTMPTDLSVATSVVAVDDPQWLVYAVAAELARNDYAKEEQYTNLIGQANDLYMKMVDAAQMSSALQPNGVVNAMPQSNTLNYNNYAPWGN